MANETILSLVCRVHRAAIDVGMDLSPKDVSFIISLFFEGLAHTKEGGGPAVDNWLQMISDEVNKTRDE